MQTLINWAEAIIVYVAVEAKYKIKRIKRFLRDWE